MKKNLLILLAVACLPAMAEQRTASEAQEVASSYLRSGATRHLLGVNHQAPQLSLAKKAVSAGNKVDYYVFNNSKNRGFIIVSGDDKAAPVLGYSDEGTFDENNIPDGLRYWLDCYAEQMQYLRSHPSSAYVTPSSEGTLMVTPLLTCNWNQNSPYNDQCPTYGANNTRAMTGCVATATAQVMYYHKWPKQGNGDYSYVCNVNGEGKQTLSADFGSTTYDWDNMLDDYTPDAYTTEQGNAVATLMSHVGIAERMKYGSTSGTPTYAAMEALRNYFGYNAGMRKYNRNGVVAAQWDSLIMNELQNARPVIYTGFTPKGGGHCFVLDGVNTEGYFHFNWGWGGKSNGYFLITALNPRDQGIGSFEGGYNVTQEMITNIYPDNGEPDPKEFVEATCARFWPGDEQVNLGEKARIYYKDLQFNCYGYAMYVDMAVGLFLADLDGNEVHFTTDNIKSSTYRFGSRYDKNEKYPFYFNTPATIADGDYRLWLVYKLNYPDVTEYSFLANSPNVPGYIDVKVQNGVMHFSEVVTSLGELSVTNLEAPEWVGAGNKFDLTATIANAGDEYYGNVYFALIDKNDDYKIYDPMSINVTTGDNVTVKSVVTAPTEPGEYELVVLNKDLAKIAGGSVNVVVLESSDYDLEIATPLQVADYNMDMGDVKATAVLSNSGSGDYVGPIPFKIISGDGKWIKYLGYTNVVVIPAGESATVDIKTAFEGVPGVEYKMCLRDVKYPNNNYSWGAAVPFMLNPVYPTVLLNKLFDDEYGEGEYRLADNLTIADTHDQSVFATDGCGSWIELKCGDNFETVKAMNALKAGTVWGNYSLIDGNPSITLTKLPEAGLVIPDVVETLDLSQQFTLQPAQVIDFAGYYFVENDKPVIYAHDGSDGDKGVCLSISFDWLDVFTPLEEGGCYNLHGVMMITPAASGAPALKDEEGSTVDCTIYLTKAPSEVTAINNVNTDAVKVSVAGGTIQVAGASRVAIYNTAGALVSRNTEVQLPAGVYIVVADGKPHKVIVR